MPPREDGLLPAPSSLTSSLGLVRYLERYLTVPRRRLRCRLKNARALPAHSSLTSFLGLVRFLERYLTVVGMFLILPEMMSARICMTFATSDFGTFGLILPASTPLPQTFFSLAASSAPRPQPLATWKITPAPCSIWFSAICLHFAWSFQSSE